jgi:hypothetical protein
MMLLSAVPLFIGKPGLQLMLVRNACVRVSHSVFLVSSMTVIGMIHQIIGLAVSGLLFQVS